MNVSISDDYAVARYKDLRFYFGYEVTKGDEWCFEAKRGTEVLATWSASELGIDSNFEVVEGLIAGAVRFGMERVVE